MSLHKASAPGSLMLLGEYAVLEGGSALVAAVNHRMSVSLAPRRDTKINISSQLGELQFELACIEVQPPFQFVATVLKRYQSRLPSGCDITIKSEFSDKIGFASSAAVTVAMVSVLHDWLGLSITKQELILEAREVVREVQGMGSGADVAACVLGGVVAYCAEPFYAEKLDYHYPISVAYSGYKTKTVDVIRHVNNNFSNNIDALLAIKNEINVCARSGINAARENNHVELGKIMNAQQEWMEKLTVNTESLNKIIMNMRSDTNILGAKISGSGLGDCAVGLGLSSLMTDKIDVEISTQGVCHEEN